MAPSSRSAVEQGIAERWFGVWTRLNPTHPYSLPGEDEGEFLAFVTDLEFYWIDGDDTPLFTLVTGRTLYGEYLTQMVFRASDNDPPDAPDPFDIQIGNHTPTLFDAF